VLRFATKFASPVGVLAIVVDELQQLTHIYFVRSPQPGAAREAVQRIAPGAVWSRGQCEAVTTQLREYFAHQRKQFDLPLAPAGSPFQQRVWQLLQAIPYGETRTYGELARALGAPKGAQAVGRANATNPVPIVIPCHRVVGSHGQLTGYGGGLPAKDALLIHEGVRGPWLFT
jgi:methylated-DNA-[protein]-cysteine S-methyltransferase